MKLVLDAIRFSEKAHRGQTRKASGLPYFVHPLHASYLVARFKPKSKNLESLIAALILHDVMEDCGVTFQTLVRRFNPMVASLCLELKTDKEECKRLGKIEYLKKRMVGYSTYGLFGKLCDRLSNVMDNPTEKTKEETRILLDHIEKNRKLTATHKKVITEIKEFI